MSIWVGFVVSCFLLWHVIRIYISGLSAFGPASYCTHTYFTTFLLLHLASEEFRRKERYVYNRLGTRFGSLGLDGYMDTGADKTEA